jgi:hypothetical protein
MGERRNAYRDIGRNAERSNRPRSDAQLAPFVKNSMKSHLKISLLVLLAAAVALFAIDAAYLAIHWIIASRDPGVGAAHRNIQTATTHPAEWTLSEERRSQLLAGLRRINMGDKKQKVVSVLGNPDEDRILEPIGVNPQPHGSIISYQVVRYERELTNERWDQVILFIFDTDDRLREIYSTVSEVRSSKASGNPVTRSD